jgi:hypothetical protein
VTASTAPTSLVGRGAGRAARLLNPWRPRPSLDCNAIHTSLPLLIDCNAIHTSKPSLDCNAIHKSLMNLNPGKVKYLFVDPASALEERGATQSRLPPGKRRREAARCGDGVRCLLLALQLGAAAHPQRPSGQSTVLFGRHWNLETKQQVYSPTPSATGTKRCSSSASCSVPAHTNRS